MDTVVDKSALLATKVSHHLSCWHGWLFRTKNLLISLFSIVGGARKWSLVRGSFDHDNDFDYRNVDTVALN